ncbi:MAG: ORF6N domain-containing protein [Nitrospinae bacterium]|nr:ORF6N domain-containing protein [Nitrospinota bacterium]
MKSKAVKKANAPAAALAERRIFLVREQAVMLDSHLAELYGVETFNLNKAVRRNKERFPEDFMFQLTKEEAESLRFQFGISKAEGRGGRRYLPHVFTEQGVAMLSGVLRSGKAVRVNIEIMRAFVRMKRALIADRELARRMEMVEKTTTLHGERITVLSGIVRGMIEPPEKPKRKIGFTK